MTNEDVTPDVPQYFYDPDSDIWGFGYGGHVGVGVGIPVTVDGGWQIQGYKNLACVPLP